MKTKITVRNCPPPFRFKCPKTWDELASTEDPNVRHCDQCQQLVHLCPSDAETIAHAKAGHCIAREIPDNSELPRLVVGQPSEPIECTEQQLSAMRWRSREDGVDDSLRNLDAIRSCPKCGYPAPHWRIQCRVCGFAFGRTPPDKLEQA